MLSGNDTYDAFELWFNQLDHDKRNQQQRFPGEVLHLLQDASPLIKNNYQFRRGIRPSVTGERVCKPQLPWNRIVDKSHENSSRYLQDASGRWAFTELVVVLARSSRRRVECPCKRWWGHTSPEAIRRSFFFFFKTDLLKTCTEEP